MRLLLINPFISSQCEVILNEPMGLICLASYVEQQMAGAVEVKLLDLYALGCGQEPVQRDGYQVFGLCDEERISALIRESNPDVIGITANFTAFYYDSMEVAQIAKRCLPAAKVVLGGAHSTIEDKSILENNPSVDFVVRGEGELTLRDLLLAIKDGVEDYGAIDGLSWRGMEGHLVRNRDRDFIKNLDELPIPNRKFVDLEVYKKLNSRSLSFTRKVPIAIVSSSRGCPFNCVFCSTKNVWKRLWRPRSAELIIQEIEILHREYGIREIAFEDDQFLLSKERVHQICDHFISRGLDLSFSIPSGASIWLVDEALLRKMRKAGFYRLCYPIETGSQTTMDFIGKPVNLNKVRETIRLTHRLGYWTQGNFIIGFPYETAEDIRQTIDFAYSCGLDYAFFFIAKPYAGSELFEIMKKEGFLSGSDVVRSSMIEYSHYNVKNFTAEQLNEIRSKAMKGFYIRKPLFYLNPRNFFTHLLPKFRSLDDIKYAFKIFKALLRVKFGIKIFGD